MKRGREKKRKGGGGRTPLRRVVYRVSKPRMTGDAHHISSWEVKKRKRGGRGEEEKNGIMALMPSTSSIRECCRGMTA